MGVAALAPARTWDGARILRRLILGLLVVWVVFGYSYAIATGGIARPGSDLHGYLEGAAQFVATGTPYTIPDHPMTWEEMLAELPFLHPPIALYLFVPFLFLPTFLWWAIPVGILAWCAWRWRPNEWAWIGSLVVLGWPPYIQNVQTGNTDMWVAAMTGLGLVYGWPAALLFLKPHSAIPWALVGVRRRSFWVALAVVAVAAIPFGYLWAEWFVMLSKVAGGSPWSYFTKLLPLVPVVLYLGRTTREGSREVSSWSPSARRTAAGPARSRRAA